MRELKFRAFVKDKKKVLPVYSLDFSWIESEPVTVASCGDLNCGLCFDAYEKENVEIMQYTGLKDKNGKEIYEGDILKVRKSISDETEVYFRVKYTGAAFALVHPEYHNAIYMEVMPWYVRETAEVIGNIYENPNLLKEE
ncbi:YopX family protein [Heyndrickxia oleronia]|uniref:YopX family protein n=1 Tax=Heyndrickxia oleronia TaxID=38875 RepID=UPI0020410B7C|nr:YopX family protein [Heyndrickxia oleronia]MCM3456580.1 YopX family protein [Heyndrickxia oleronia]